ncbi:heavy metal translocating P-type ATPase [Oryzibacter oryziterrae]|uniref:heavy metal translocating P-type ATPase n=1 Tax=Oryzibacter oryziterrae TaxID=2766474 RepID=UPI001F466A5B|nr:heavy metal translocating P-type ATPase [Oryzibacter oryziterrae]
MSTIAKETRFRIEGMDCASCAAKIDTAVRRLPGVSDVTVSVTRGTMIVHHEHGADLVEPIAKRVTGLGYGIAKVSTEPATASEDQHVCGCGHDHCHADGPDEPRHSHAESHAHGASPARHVHHGHDHAHQHGDERRAAGLPIWATGKGRLTIASGVGLVAAWSLGRLVPDVEVWLFAAAMLIGLVPIARRAVMAAVSGTPFSIEMLMTIAAAGAVLIGAAEEAAVVVFLFLIGELLEGVAASKARSSIEGLTSLVPETALLEDGGSTREVRADSLAAGATIVIRPGDRIAADGVILAGESAVDEASITGESLPVHKTVDASVFAGTINGDGVLRVRVTAAAADNTIARVIRLVEDAQETKAPTERFIDRFSRFYTPAVFFIAVAVAVLPPLVMGLEWRDWIYKGLAVLLIGCPCALVISTPAAIAASLAAGARRGLLLKGGAILESLGGITAVAFDKTGTLTTGRPVVTDIIGNGETEGDVLGLAASLEAGSNHPLAKAITDRATTEGAAMPQAEEVRAIGGKGISGRIGGAEVFLGSASAVAERVAVGADVARQIAELHEAGKTVSVLTRNDAIAGLVAMRDEVRPDAARGLQALAKLGVRSIMLTGDNRHTAQAIGSTLGIEVRAELLPQDKQRIVKELQATGLKVAKVGDGINDAPALAAADIGIAMGGGADVALDTADAAILHGRVGDVASMIKLSRRTMANIRQNITLALGLKGVFLVTTLLGISGLWPAILADTGATVLVTMNALRLLKIPD